jgi:peptidoglycan/xylan/chitin deacetylase (PgdA/CDA1 family)
MQVPVIAYHKIDEPSKDIRIRGAFTSPKRFAGQMSYLKREGFVFYSASALIEHYLEHGRFPSRGIALTFDDGWKDNYINAFPVLRELGIRATIFLVPSCIGQVTSKVVAEGESARAHLSLADITEMSGHGIEFGSHSMNHELLHQLSPQDVKYEVEESKRQIEDLLQQPCKVFAYPAGFYTETAREAVKRAGYVAAFSSVYGPSEELDIYALNRTEILRRDRFPFQFARKIKRMVDQSPA